MSGAPLPGSPRSYVARSERGAVYQRTHNLEPQSDSDGGQPDCQAPEKDTALDKQPAKIPETHVPTAQTVNGPTGKPAPATGLYRIRACSESKPSQILDL